jgi:hypothetical protein
LITHSPTPSMDLVMDLADSPATTQPVDYIPPHCYPWETDMFHQCWKTSMLPKFKHLGQYQDFYVLKKPLLKNLLTLKELRLSGWNSAWSQAFDASRLTMLTNVHQTCQWDYFRVISTPPHQPDETEALLRSGGFNPIAVSIGDEFIIDLQKGLDQYYQSLSKNARRNVIRKVNKAEKLGHQIKLVDWPQTEEGIDDFFKLFFQHHIRHWDKKSGYSYFNDTNEQKFMVAYTRALAREGKQLLLKGLEIDGELAHLSMSIVSGSIQYWLLIIGTDCHSDLVPGILNLYLELQDAEARGIAQFNMGAGEYFYKIQLANIKRPRTELIVPNPKSFPGKVYAKRLARYLMNVKPSVY